MKFSCDQCHAQYMIADEKVSDRGVKVRCKKCANIIVVKAMAPSEASSEDSNASPEAVPSSSASDSTAQAASQSESTPPSDETSKSSEGDLGGAFDSLFGGGDGSWEDAATGNRAEAASKTEEEHTREWYVAVGDAQIGPIAIAEVETRWDSGELSEDSLAWKAGMPDWQPIGEIEGLAYLVTEKPQNKTEAAGKGLPKAAGKLGPVAFGDSAAGGESVAWKPSAASALSSLVQEELDTEKREQEESAKAEEPKSNAPEGLGIAGLGGADLFSGGGGSALPAPGGLSGAADPFPGASPGWSVPEPRKEGGLKAAHLVMGIALIFGVGILGLGALYVVKTPSLFGGGSNPEATAEAAPKKDSPKPSAAKPAKEVKAASSGNSTAKRAAPARSSKSKSKSKRRKGTASKPRPQAVAKKSPPPAPAKPAVDPNAKASLTKSDILGVVKAKASSVKTCITTAKAKGEIRPGSYRFVLNWTIRPNGSVGSPRLVGPSNVMGTSLPRCFATQLGKWKFPSSQSGAPIKNFPLPINVR